MKGKETGERRERKGRRKDTESRAERHTKIGRGNDEMEKSLSATNSPHPRHLYPTHLSQEMRKDEGKKREHTSKWFQILEIPYSTTVD